MINYEESGEFHFQA